MALHQFFRTVNTINPTTWGRGRVLAMAKRAGALPPPGVLALDPMTWMWLGRDAIDLEIYFRAFEVLCSSVILGRLRPGHVFVDVGANIGYYALRARHRVGASGRVFAFEPNPVTFDKLRRNTELSGASGMDLFCWALADFSGEATMHLHPDPAQHGFSSLKNQGWSDPPTSVVAVRQLDEVLPAGLARVDLIKIDVEGAELAVLRGAARIIAHYRPEIFIELNEDTARSFGHEPFEIPRLLLSHHPDYRFKHVGSHAVRELTLEQMEREGIRDGNLLAY